MGLEEVEVEVGKFRLGVEAKLGKEILSPPSFL